MSYIINITRETIKFKNKNRETPYFSKFFEEDDKYIFFSGEYHSTLNQFKRLDWNLLDIETIKKIKESFSIITLDKKTGILSFALSYYGIERLYYYYTDSKFIISDDFWEIVDCLDIAYADLDIESIEESMNGSYPLFDGTFVKNIKYVLPGTLGKYDWKTNNINVTPYFDYRYHSASYLDIDKATDRLNCIINDAVLHIKEECGDVKYAFGLSGGLDSRIIPHYMQNNNIKINSFIIGDIRPNLFFLAGDHLRAREISKIFSSNHCECKWDKETLQETIYYDIKNNPMGLPQFFKGQKDCKFDVLLTGGNGYIVGSTIPENIEFLTIDELASVMMQLGRDFKPNTIRNNHIETAVWHIFKRKIHLNHYEKWYDVLLKQSTQIRIHDKFCAFIETEKKKGKNNFDIYEGYFHNILGARNKFGGFESLNGSKRSFSIYLPAVLDEAFDWQVDFLKDRTVLKNLIKKYIPEVANIKEQKYEGNTITASASTLNKIFNIMEYLIRGNGSEMVNSKFKKYQELFIADMTKETTWFYNIFGIRPYLNKIIRHDNKYALMKIWKIKKILDILETREYKEYLDRNNYIVMNIQN